MKIIICFVSALLLFTVNSQKCQPCPDPKPAPNFICPDNIQAACGYGLGIRSTFSTACDACKVDWVRCTSEGACI